MFDATRRWLRRNRTSFAVGFGVISIGYVASQYVISKVAETRDRMASDRVAKENLRRRFQQNQEDCTITVLELLPTVTGNVLEALNSEQVTQELQEKKVQRLGRCAAASETTPSEFSSVAPDEDGKSLSSESNTHTSQLRSSNSHGEQPRPTRTKAQLWNDLKNNSIIRAFTLLYTVSLLSLLTRIQLNLLGRRNYVSSVVSQVSLSPRSSTINLENRDNGNTRRGHYTDFETNRRYLTFSWWLLHRGWKDIMSQVETAVEEAFGPVKVTEMMSLDRLSGLILDVRRRVEGSSVQERSTRRWLPYLLPPKDKEVSLLQISGFSMSPSTSLSNDASAVPSAPGPTYGVDPTAPSQLRSLLDETADLIESPMFTHVLTLLLDATFSQMTDRKIRSEAYKLPPLRGEGEVQTEDIMDHDPATASVKLASILAVLTREAHNIGGGVPNEYVHALEGVNDLEAFAAVIYSSDLHNEASNITPSSTSGMQPIEKAGYLGRSNTFVKQAAKTTEAAWANMETAWVNLVG